MPTNSNKKIICIIKSFKNHLTLWQQCRPYYIKHLKRHFSANREIWMWKTLIHSIWLSSKSVDIQLASYLLFDDIISIKDGKLVGAVYIDHKSFWHCWRWSTIIKLKRMLKKWHWTVWFYFQRETHIRLTVVQIIQKQRSLFFGVEYGKSGFAAHFKIVFPWFGQVFIVFSLIYLLKIIWFALI